MAFTVPPLPFAMDALEQYMSSKTLSYHPTASTTKLTTTH